MNIEEVSTNPLYYEFLLDTSALVEGEYTLHLYDDDNRLLATTMVQIGNYQPSKVQYNVEKKYITYNGK